MSSWIAALLPLALSISTITTAAPVKRQNSVDQTYLYPAIAQNFPDPAILQVNNEWYAYATSSGGINAQVAKAPSFENGWVILNQDALPNLPSWATKDVWAPSVIQRNDGQYVMYYSAALAQIPSKHCIGVALSSTPDGPFQPVGDVPLICPNPDGQGTNVNPTISSAGQGGAIDPSAYRDTDGKLYIAYKVDGNSLGSGGACNNGNGAQSTPLMVVAVADDAISPIGEPVQILDRIVSLDGPLVEAPALSRTADGTYNLFFSSNCFDTPEYDVSWASSTSIFGPYSRRGPLFVTGNDGLVAPGGPSVSSDGTHIAFHADFGTGRAMYTNLLSAQYDSIKLLG